MMVEGKCLIRFCVKMTFTFPFRFLNDKFSNIEKNEIHEQCFIYSIKCFMISRRFPKKKKKIRR